MSPRRANRVMLADTVTALPPQPLFVDHEVTTDHTRVGPHDHLSRAQVLELLPTLPIWNLDLDGTPLAGGKNEATRNHRRMSGAAAVLTWLETHPGDGWQARWRTAGCDRDKQWYAAAVADLPGCEGLRFNQLVSGLTFLFLNKIVLPDMLFLRGYKAMRLFKYAQLMFPPGTLDTMRRFVESVGMSESHLQQGLRVISSLVLHTGRDLPELTAEDIISVRALGRRCRGEAFPGTFPAWDLLRAVGVIQSQDSLKDALRHGQRPTAELVDQHNVQSTTIRNVLVRYLEERRPGLDYGSFRGLVGELVKVFWVDIETHHPGIDSLRLPPEVVDGWKQRLLTYVDKAGNVRERRGRVDIMMRVRGFYLDIQEWAHEDPFWAPHAVPSPINRGDGAGGLKIVTQTQARMHQRVRERLPHLPVLVETAERVRHEAADLLAAAAAAVLGTEFEHAGRRYLRILPAGNKTPGREVTDVYIREVGSTALHSINQTHAEDDAFWAWVVVETLRHTGVRVEELTEITHLALVSYRLPDTGEVVPLLQIVPSKSNEERLLLVSPELASVLATIITRLRNNNGGKVPLVARYDHHERVTGPPLPHLFQRRPYWQNQVFSYAAIKRLLDATLAHTGLRDAAGEPLRYTPHDFRRMFATEAVTGGLPVHIAARLLGHKSLSTTQAYLAVFQDDLVRTYRGFLDRRRADRPAEEYREPTDQEWLEFQQHFELRKVSLGTCGRPYGSPCKHEHACIRCPVLRMDPRQRQRLVEIIANLRDRIAEARHNGWLGEVEGLQTSLNAAAAKLTSLDRTTTTARPTITDLGMPIITLA
ncbi:site-specific integrase [Kutzneria buriramensis]|uniref:Phage integrase family protein n=1 Tax=Kutzneria buriramensis TaxID=1045776 RepID=A0A3E0GXK9_9PSEU|nr:site-specific integrase [Kutzneria buriramensis]REH31004.1 phage integrase family protein [Kutzneria buriramensis]